MSTSTIVPVVRRNRFPSTGLMQRNAPTSEMVLQALVQSIVQLNQKVDSLAQTRFQPTLFQQPQQFVPPPQSQLPAIGQFQEQVTLTAPPQRQARVIRSRLLEFFE